MRRYEKGSITDEHYWPSLARMEADETTLKAYLRQYEKRQQARASVVANFAEEWDNPDFTMEQKQAAIAQTLTAVIIKPTGKCGRFHPDQIVPYSGKTTRNSLVKNVAQQGFLPGHVSSMTLPFSCRRRYRVRRSAPPVAPIPPIAEARS
jgi:hypothetical protein